MNRFARKIKNLSFDELKERANQLAGRTAERLSASRHRLELSDEEMVRRLNFGEGPANKGLLAHLEKQAGANFYPSFSSPAATSELFRKRTNASDAVLAKAEAVCRGQFKLLGLGEHVFEGGTPDWHLEWKAGIRSPLAHWTTIDELSPVATGDKKIIWELNRHQYFATLGQAYWLTGDERYSSVCAEHLADWMESNPPKLGVNWLSSLEISFRSISWIWAYHFFRGSEPFKEGLLMRMIKYLYLNGKHIERYLSTYFSPNTHLTGEALGLYMLGSFFSGSIEGERWKRKGVDIMLNALDFQVRPDGTYCEQTTHYLKYTVDLYCNLLILRSNAGTAENEKIKAKLNLLFDCLLHTSYPRGQSINFGDDDGGRLYFLDDKSVSDLRPAFALGAVLLRRPDLKQMSGDATAELLWLLGSEGLEAFEAMPSTEPGRVSMGFYEGGLFAARSDWSADADGVVIDCGPHGFLNCGHAHADALSFVLAVGGNPVFVDPGTYNYTSEPGERDLFRSTPSHNCLTVNCESSSIPAGPFSWKSTATSRLIEWVETPTGIRFKGTHDGYSRLGVDYQRSLEFRGVSLLEIEESIKCKVHNRYEVNFILSPGFTAEIIEEPYIVQIRAHAGEPVLMAEGTLTGDGLGSLVWRVEPWQFSPTYGAKVPTQKLVLVAEAAGNLVIRTVINKITSECLSKSN